MRHGRSYAYGEIDSSPESYRNVSMPQENVNISQQNVLSKNPKEEKQNFGDDNHPKKLGPNRDHSGAKNKFSYYLRRSGQNTSIDEKLWIIVENEFVL